MAFDYAPIEYEELTAVQKENYNYQKVCAVLADYGFSTVRLTDDWMGADFIAQHTNSDTILKIQLKGRLTFDRKYLEKDIHIAFPEEGEWYLIPHDELLAELSEKLGIIKGTESWEVRGAYSIGGLSEAQLEILDPYRIVPVIEGTGAEVIEGN